MKTLEMLEKSLSEQESRQNEDRMKYGEKCREQPTIKSLRRGSVLPTMQAVKVNIGRSVDKRRFSALGRRIIIQHRKTYRVSIICHSKVIFKCPHPLI